MYAQHMPPMTQTAQVAVLHDARAVHDTATLRFISPVRGGKAQWIVARISPGPQSGSQTIPGASIRADTGRFTAPQGAQLSIVKQGNWSVLGKSAETVASEGTYSWTEGVDEEKRSLSAEDIYSPFTTSGVIVFAPGGAASGPAQFSDAHLIFDEWADQVDPASRYVHDHESLFGGNEALSGSEAQLHMLLSNENPLLRIAAFRELLARGRATPEIIESALGTAGHVAAVVTYLVLQTGDTGLTDIVKQFAATTVDERLLRPIALGAYTASVFDGRQRSIGATAAFVLGAVANKLSAARGSDAYLNALLSK